MQSKQYFTKIKNYPHEKSTEPVMCERRIIEKRAGSKSDRLSYYIIMKSL